MAATEAERPLLADDTALVRPELRRADSRDHENSDSVVRIHPIRLPSSPGGTQELDDRIRLPYLMGHHRVADGPGRHCRNGIFARLLLPYVVRGVR
jgi:hypothetical protein